MHTVYFKVTTSACFTCDDYGDLQLLEGGTDWINNGHAMLIRNKPALTTVYNALDILPISHAQFFVKFAAPALPQLTPDCASSTLDPPRAHTADNI